MLNFIALMEVASHILIARYGNKDMDITDSGNLIIKTQLALNYFSDKSWICFHNCSTFFTSSQRQ
jgi:hypothetical protein